MKKGGQRDNNGKMKHGVLQLDVALLIGWHNLWLLDVCRRQLVWEDLTRLPASNDLVRRSRDQVVRVLDDAIMDEKLPHVGLEECRNFESLVGCVGLSCPG